MVTVFVNERETLENALKRFSKKVQKEGITKKVKEKMYFVKPSQVKRDKASKAKRKLEKKQRGELRQ